MQTFLEGISPPILSTSRIAADQLQNNIPLPVTGLIKRLDIRVVRVREIDSLSPRPVLLRALRKVSANDYADITSCGLDY